MKLWRRRESGIDFDMVTELDEEGGILKYLEFVTPAGEVDTLIIIKTSLSEMGWPDVKTFLAKRKGFVEV